MAAPVVMDLLLKDSKFRASMRNAQNSVNKFSKGLSGAGRPLKQLTRGVSTLGSGVSRVAKSVVSLQGAIVAAAAAFGVSKVIEAANQQEKAVKGLASAMASTGEFSKAALKDMEAFASSLQDVTGVGDETTLEMLSLAKAYGLTNQQAKDVLKTSVDLSAQTGQSLKTSVEQLSGAYNGQIGRLSKMNPELVKLSKEQLAAGEATRILGQQMGGYAAGQLQTFGGSIEATTGRFGDMLEEIGFLITKNPIVIEVVKQIGTAFQQFGEYIKENKDSISEFVSGGVIFMAKSLQVSIKTVALMTKGFQYMTKGLASAADMSLRLIQAFYEFEFVQKILKGIVQAVLAVETAIWDMIASFLRIPGVNKFFRSVGVDIDTVTYGLDQASQKAQEFATSFKGDEASKAIEKIREGVKSATESIAGDDGFFDSISSGADKVAGKIGSITDALKNLPKKASTAIEVDVKNAQIKNINQGQDSGLGKSPSSASDLGKNAPILTEENLFGERFKRSAIDAFNAGAQTFSSVVSGDAKGFVGAAGGALSDAFFPGTGQAVSQVLQLLSGGPDQVKAQIEAFVEQLPVIIDAIVESIPVVIDALVAHSDTIAIRLAEAIVLKVPVALAKGVALAINRILYNALQEFNNLLSSVFKNGLVDGLNAAFSGISKEIGKLTGALSDVSKLWTGLIDKIESFVNSITGRSDGSTNETTKSNLTIGGTVRKIGEAFGLATGITEVPAGFPNDTFPARLTSGEGVIDARTNPRLIKFLDEWDSRNSNQNPSQQGGQMINVVLQIGQDELARQILRLDQDGFTIRAA